jgi:hypothetical protein
MLAAASSTGGNASMRPQLNLPLVFAMQQQNDARYGSKPCNWQKTTL